MGGIVAAVLAILWHMGPMMAGAGYSIYQEGLNIDYPTRQMTMSAVYPKRFKSHADYLAYLRSQAQKAIFAKAHPCPATNKPVMSCKGYVIDHIKPLCDGGPDLATNMQWQTDAASYKKDAIERRVCACHKAGKTNCADPWATHH